MVFYLIQNIRESSNKGREKKLGNIEVNVSTLGMKGLQALYPLLHAQLMDYRDTKSAKKLEIELPKCSKLKRYFLMVDILSDYMNRIPLAVFIEDDGGTSY